MTDWAFALQVVLSSASSALVGTAFLLTPARHGAVAWAAFAAAGLTVATAQYFLTRWDFFGTAAQLATVGVLLGVACWRLRAIWQITGAGYPAIGLPTLLALAVVAVVVAGSAYVFRRPAGPMVELAMPLRDVAWYVAQGGATTLTNHHHAVPAQRHALDVTVVADGGTRARGLRPPALEDYHAFGVPVASPCHGRVVVVRADLPDQPIGGTDRVNPAGNFVAIGCRDATVILAHLRAGSVAVRVGDELRMGQHIGQVGNSGNTTEPHLHVHAVAGEVRDLESLLYKGVGLPALFDGEYLRRGARVHPD